MRSKRLLSLALVGAMAVTSVAGCSKSKIRKIEGASDDVQKFVGVVEEVYGMKGYAVESSVEVEKGFTLTTKEFTDSKDNMKLSVYAKGEVHVGDLKLNLDDEIVVVSLIGNDVYVDISKLYEAAKRNIGEATIATLQTALDQSGMNMKVEDMLVTKMSLGDIDRSGLTRDSLKGFVQKCTDIFAVALTDTNSLKVDGDKYTVTIDGSFKDGSFVKKLAQGIVDNKEALFDGFIGVVEGVKLPDNFIALEKAIIDAIKASSPELEAMLFGTGGEIELPDTDEMKAEVQKAIDDLKSFKSEFMANVTMDGIEDNEGFDTPITFEVTDTKEGYMVSGTAGELPMNNVIVTEYKDTIAAPANAKDGGVVAILAGVLAPQYLKYVEKSRDSSDRMLVEEVKNAIMTVLFDDQVYSKISESDYSDMTIEFNGSKFYTNNSSAEIIIDAIKDILGSELGGFQSKEYNSKVVKYVINYDKDYYSFDVDVIVEDAVTD